MMQSGGASMVDQQQQQATQYQQQYPIPPNMQHHHQQQQQWMLPSQQPQPPPAGWTPSPVPPPQPLLQQHQQQQYYSQYQQMQQQQQQPPTGSREIRSLWIGDLQPWMEENYLVACFSAAGQAVSAKVIRNKHTGQPEGYGFIEFLSRDAAEQALQAFNGTPMPSAEQVFRLNWATLGAGERRADEGNDFTIFVGDLASDVTDYVLQETFRVHYPSVKGAKVVTDRVTGRTKGYGFVRFADESEQLRAMTEMNGAFCSTRPMRIGQAATKKQDTQQYQKAPYQSTQGSIGESDPTNTTIFIGGLDPSVLEEHLRQHFSPYGELVHVKIPAGKRCGFVQFAERSCAEQALAILNGSQLGGQSVRLSWGRTPSSKQGQSDQAQWNNGGGYYGYEAYGGYTAPTQDPSMYYSGYPAYGNYQQQPQQ